MTRALVLMLLGALAGCHDHEHPHHGDPGHDERGSGDHGHGDAPEDPRPTETVTRYQGPLELFMEYPAFVTGQPSPLVAHFTDTRDPDGFEVVTKGEVVATLRYSDGHDARFVADTLLRDGIFKPVVTPPRAGPATLSLTLSGPQVEGRIDVGDVVVHPSVEAAVASAPDEAAAGEQSVPYLKEQQWKTTYATAVAAPASLRGSVRVYGEIVPAAGRRAELAASVGGRVEVPGAVPRTGQAVRQGELLVTLVPSGVAGGADRPALELEVRRARAERGLAERELRRMEELFAARAVPERDLDAARVAVETARARERSANAQLAALRSVQGKPADGRGAVFELRAPFDGVVADSRVMPGAFVEAGAPLLTVLDPREVWLAAHVPEQDLAALDDLSSVGLTPSGSDAEIALGNDQRVAVAPTLDPKSRTAMLLFAVPNEDGRLRPGQSARVALYTEPVDAGVVIPRAAVIDDNGLDTVFVMEGGESFFKRRVRLGVRDGGRIQVLDGVAAGDRVISRGAYEVKLSTAAGAIPAHGHAH